MNEPGHHDALQALNEDGSLRYRLREIRLAVRAFMPFIARIAVAIYDPKTTLLKTFAHSSEGEDPLPHYQAPIAEVPSLKQLLDEGRSRVIQNMLTFENAESEHAKRLGPGGLRGQLHAAHVRERQLPGVRLLQLAQAGCLHGDWRSRSSTSSATSCRCW